MNKSILITGTTGYVGGFLADSLGGDFRIYAMNRRPMKSLNQDCQILVDKKSNIEFDRNLNIDSVIHCMGIAHKKFWLSQKRIEEVNIDLTLKIARAAIRAGVKKFIFISTANVFGISHDRRNNFSFDSECRPNGAYALSKFKAEIELKKMFDLSATQLIILRPPLIYRSGCYKGNLKLLELFVKFRIPLPIGLLTTKRSYLSLENLSNFIRVCINEKFQSEIPFLVRNKENLTLMEVTDLISKSILIDAKVVNVNLKLVKLITYILFGKNIAHKLFQELNLNQEITIARTGWHPVDS
ncbi:NAD-dependent epimerase/dehydratase family protein [Polynucleobacter sp. MWH-UH23A]|uniref:NAD-dependent epimerase/dehydratase family protein n=1 Tax=Polynucleobacter sp. MWH-UH23A TaxID=1855613 RepID=UPI00336518BD